MTEVVNHPINKDERNWFQRMINEPGHVFLYNVSTMEAFNTVNWMNARYADKWHCRIKRVIIGNIHAHKTSPDD